MKDEDGSKGDLEPWLSTNAAGQALISLSDSASNDQDMSSAALRRLKQHIGEATTFGFW